MRKHEYYATLVGAGLLGAVLVGHAANGTTGALTLAGLYLLWFVLGRLW